MFLKDLPALLKETFAEWRHDQAGRLAAALAYYTLFSLAPLLIIIIGIAGFVFEQAAVQAQMMAQLQDLVGADGAHLIGTMIGHAFKRGSGLSTTLLGLVILIVSATGLFAQLRGALNTIWATPQKPGGGLKTLIRERLVAFVMILAIGFLLLGFLILSAVLAALGQFLVGLAPSLIDLLQWLNFILSLAIITVLFALIFKILPDLQIAWGDVWIGGCRCIPAGCAGSQMSRISQLRKELKEAWQVFIGERPP